MKLGRVELTTLPLLKGYVMYYIQVELEIVGRHVYIKTSIFMGRTKWFCDGTTFYRRYNDKPYNTKQVLLGISWAITNNSIMESIPIKFGSGVEEYIIIDDIICGDNGNFVNA